MGHDIFVSYSTKDKLFVDALVNKLEYNKLRCWYAPRDIPAGVTWPSAITHAIKNTPVMLLVFSGAANESQEVSRELTMASNYKSLVIPVRIENISPGIEFEYHLTNRHWLDVYDLELDAAISRVVEGLQRYSPLFQKQQEQPPKAAPTAAKNPTPPPPPHLKPAPSAEVKPAIPAPTAIPVFPQPGSAQAVQPPPPASIPAFPQPGPAQSAQSAAPETAAKSSGMSPVVLFLLVGVLGLLLAGGALFFIMQNTSPPIPPVALQTPPPAEPPAQERPESAPPSEEPVITTPPTEPPPATDDPATQAETPPPAEDNNAQTAETPPPPAATAEPIDNAQLEGATLSVFTGSTGLTVQHLGLGGTDADELNQEFLVQVTGFTGAWDKHVFRCQIEIKGHQERYVTTIDGQRFVLFIIQKDGTGVVFQPGTDREFQVTYNEVRSQQGSIEQLVAAYHAQEKPPVSMPAPALSPVPAPSPQ